MSHRRDGFEMNSLEKKTFPGAEARFWLPALLTAGLLTFWFATRLIAGQPATPGLTAHEWGTFTAIAGTDGHAMKWTPLTVPDDLPNFVEHLSNANFKLGLRGTIRMETPVLYFYSP